MFPGEVIYVPQLSLRKITDQSRSVTLLLISVARLVLQDMEFKIYSRQVVAHIRKNISTVLLTFFTHLQSLGWHVC